MKTTTEHAPLSLATACHLATVIGWAQRTDRVNYLDVRGDPTTGTVRAIGDQNGCRLASHEDIRDAHVRITTASGWELFLPMADVLARLASGEMAADR